MLSPHRLSVYNMRWTTMPEVTRQAIAILANLAQKLTEITDELRRELRRLEGTNDDS